MAKSFPSWWVWLVKYCPFFIPLVVLIGLYFYLPQDAKSVVINRLIDHTLRINTVLLGFFLTIYTLIKGIENRTINWIKRANMMPRILSYMKQAIILQFLSVVLILLSSLVLSIDEDRPLCWFDYVLVYFMAAAITSAVRFTYIFIMIIDSDKD